MAVQSPIGLDIRQVNLADDVTPLEYHGHFDLIGRAYVENTQTSAQITLDRAQKPFIIGGPLGAQKYLFEQLHFHWGDHDHLGCEHTIEGCRYSMEAHAVHYNAKYRDFQEAVTKPDGIAVTGFFIQALGDRDLPEFNKIAQGITKVGEPKAKVQIDPDCLSWMNLQDLSKHYYTYKGSLTTPPYYESVTWIVYKSPVYVSSRQIELFRGLCCSKEDHSKKIINNFRDVQRPRHNPRVVFVRNCINTKSKL
ncbi:carbonic anhydrase 2-like [Lutzomyia longipalpis]|uniref:carbonic anhydrase 2-like n=1 Tax=Lutzomyia longipalpis TaxID=7200 RepID=UPI002483CB03|nr:carbonic anhydrase 2-like [Lutzomyia longipalpis]